MHVVTEIHLFKMSHTSVLVDFTFGFITNVLFKMYNYNL